MANKARNKNLKTQEVKELILKLLHESQGEWVKSENICSIIQSTFDLEFLPPESNIRSLVRSLRNEHGYWQLVGSVNGYMWSTDDGEYFKWKCNYQSQISSMIKTLYIIENSYVSDINSYLKKKGGKPTAQPIFNFLPDDIDWDAMFDESRAIRPLKIDKKKKAKTKKRKSKDSRGKVFKIAKQIRKDGEPWLEAVSRASKNKSISKSWSQENPKESLELKNLAEHFQKNEKSLQEKPWYTKFFKSL